MNVPLFNAGVNECDSMRTWKNRPPHHNNHNQPTHNAINHQLRAVLNLPPQPTASRTRPMQGMRNGPARAQRPGELQTRASVPQPVTVPSSASRVPSTAEPHIVGLGWRAAAAALHSRQSLTNCKLGILGFDRSKIEEEVRNVGSDRRLRSSAQGASIASPGAPRQLARHVSSSLILSERRPPCVRRRKRV